jgi:MFS family permease
VKDGLGRTAGQAAIPFALMGAGIAVTSVVILRRPDMKQRSVAFMRAMIAGSTITACIGLTDSFAVVLVLAFAMGLAGGFFINMNQGLIQSNTPPEVMGRVMGLYTLVAAGVMPVGALLLGGLATIVGTGPAITAAGVTSLVVVLVTYVRNTELRRLG